VIALQLSIRFGRGQLRINERYADPRALMVPAVIVAEKSQEIELLLVYPTTKEVP
jgi:hypothetical protein